MNIISTAFLPLLSLTLPTLHAALAAPPSTEHLHTRVVDVNGHPNLSVTKSIPYTGILMKYIASKGLDEANTCPKIYPRSEWRKLTPTKQQSWINATWCLASRPLVLGGTESHLYGRRTSLLDDFTLVHIRTFHETHYSSTFLFLPSHRWFVHARDMAMRKECGFDGPLLYWKRLPTPTEATSTSPSS
ncbi:hypothetical protein V8E36_001621 [Tilletia maclaganii]